MPHCKRYPRGPPSGVAEQWLRSSELQQRSTGIWRSHGLQPHRVYDLVPNNKIPGSLEKLTDVVGLYLNPGESTGALGLMRKVRSRH